MKDAAVVVVGFLAASAYFMKFFFRVVMLGSG
jgi:hypothetical protein